jgi:transketolase
MQLLDQLSSRQKKLRLAALERIHSWGEGSSGRTLSSLDLMEALYFGGEKGRPVFRFDPEKPQWEERDLFVLSKVSALSGLYAVLEEAGYHLPAVLPAYADRKIPGLELTSREPGFGLAAAVGMADAIQMERGNRHVFCLAADYELDCGLSWEAVMTAAERRLDHLCLIVDVNDSRDSRIQERFEAFGWKVIKLLNAHTHDDIVYAYMKARLTQRKPTCIWAPTLKSAGVPFAERKAEYDDVVFSEPEMAEARKLLSDK